MNFRTKTSLSLAGLACFVSGLLVLWAPGAVWSADDAGVPAREMQELAMSEDELEIFKQHARQVIDWYMNEWASRDGGYYVIIKGYTVKFGDPVTGEEELLTYQGLVDEEFRVMQDSRYAYAATFTDQFGQEHHMDFFLAGTEPRHLIVTSVLLRQAGDDIRYRWAQQDSYWERSL